jgi:hypothetical protein
VQAHARQPSIEHEAVQWQNKLDGKQATTLSLLAYFMRCIYYEAVHHRGAV